MNTYTQTLWRVGLAVVALQSLRADPATVVVTLDPSSVYGDYFGTVSVKTVTLPMNAGNIVATFGVPGTPDVVHMDFEFLPNHTDEWLYLGQIGFDQFNTHAGGGGLFKSGVPYVGANLTVQGSEDGYYDFQANPYLEARVTNHFRLDMPWDGTSGDWTGTWEVKWTLIHHTPVGVPDSGNTGLMTILSLVALALAGRRMASARAYV